MKKLVLGLTLTFFLGAYSASALTNLDNPPKDKAKTETKAEAKTDKKECATTAENKGCCKDKTTASAESKSCNSKASETASTK